MQVHGPPPSAARPFQRTPYPRPAEGPGPSAARSTSPVALRSTSRALSFGAAGAPHSRTTYNAKTRAPSAARPHSAQRTMPRQTLGPGAHAYPGDDARMFGRDVEEGYGAPPPGPRGTAPFRPAVGGGYGHAGQRSRPPQSGQAYGFAQPPPHADSHPMYAAPGPSMPSAAGLPTRSTRGPPYPLFAQNAHAGASRAAYVPAAAAPARDSHGHQHWHPRDAALPRASPPLLLPLRRESSTCNAAAPQRPPAQEDCAADPLIHKALGWWPDQPTPSLIWDLSAAQRPRYAKRPLDAAELAASPFTPPLARMRLVLDHAAGWAFDVGARRGAPHITLQGLLEDVAALMRAPGRVPHAFWTRAGGARKQGIVRAMLRRTGGALGVVPPHRRPKTLGQLMEEAVVEGARPGSTNLLVVDLLCEDVMFWGMEFHKEPDEWVLRTTSWGRP